MNWILLFTLLILLPVTGAGFAHFVNADLTFGLGLGIVLGLAPLVVRLLSNAVAAMKISKTIILGLLLVISLFSAQQVLYPLIVSQTILDNAQSITILILATTGLYILYLLVTRDDAFTKNQSLQKKLSILFSGPSLLLSFAMAIILTTFLLIFIHYLYLDYPAIGFLSTRLMDRGVIPPITVILFFWGLLILANKTYMLSREMLALQGKHPDQNSILNQSYYQNLQENGSIETSTYINFLWSESSNFYIIPRYINWAIPILGFIGTVLGISLAADGIQRIIGSQQGLAQMSSELGQAISPLGIAFDTTLVALSLSIVLALAQLMLQRWENKFMTEYEHQTLSAPLSKL